MDDRIADAIREVVAEATFQPEVLNRMKANIELVEQLEEALEKADNDNEILKERNRKGDQAYNDVCKELAELKGQKADVELREKAVHDAEKSHAAHQAAAETWEKACGMIFRNTAVRREVFDSENGPAGIDQYGTTQYATTTKAYKETKTDE